MKTTINSHLFVSTDHEKVRKPSTFKGLNIFDALAQQIWPWKLLNASWHNEKHYNGAHLTNDASREKC